MITTSRSMTIAVDFDGTIVEHKYPKLGKERPYAISTLKALQKKGHRLILWTYRTGAELAEAVEYCRQKGINFYAVNKNYPEEEYSESTGRKILADLYIDDRNFGGIPSWIDIYKSLHPEDIPEASSSNKQKKWWKP
jgi:hydroxymethylpyrimidine pyrophosphatase-like HAD family hydrolase